MKRKVSLVSVLIFFGLSFSCAPYHTQGAATGGAAGGAVSLLDGRNPWRGGVVGGVLGAVEGATVADISLKASQEAATSDSPVEYRTVDGRWLYRADPLGYDERTHCRKIQGRVWEEGRLVRDDVGEVCEGETSEKMPDSDGERR